MLRLSRRSSGSAGRVNLPAARGGIEPLESRLLFAGVVNGAGDVGIEAEEARLSGAVVSTQYPDFNGAGYVDYQANSGGYLDLEVDVPTAGRRYIEIRY